MIAFPIALALTWLFCVIPSNQTKHWTGETDPWNNPGEFPNDGSKQSNDRMMALKVAFMWLDANN